MLKTAIDIVKIKKMITHIPGNIDPYNEIMDIIGDIVRYFVIARADKVADELQVQMTHQGKTFIESFICTAVRISIWTLEETVTRNIECDERKHGERTEM